MPKWRDVCELTGSEIIRIVGRPTLISGGFPCQPHSLAGKRQASCDSRDLTGELKRIVREVKPRWLLFENVPGLRSSESGRFFGKFLYDISQMGYRVGWGSWGAIDVGSCHRRERIFIVAHYDEIGLRRRNSPEQWEIPYPKGRDKMGIETQSENCDVANASSHRLTWTQISKGSKNEKNETNHPGNNWKQPWPEVAARLCRVDDGIPRRVDRLRCLGNAVVPQQAYPILKAIADIEKTK